MSGLTFNRPTESDVSSSKRGRAVRVADWNAGQAGRELYVSVNLAARQAHEHGLAEDVADILGAVAESVDGVVETFTQFGRVDPAARVDARLDALVTGRTAALRQIDDCDRAEGDREEAAGGDAGVFANLFDRIDVADHRRNLFIHWRHERSDGSA